MFTVVPAPAAAALPSADFFVDSFVSCVIRAADVMDAIVAIPSTLSTIVSSVSLQEQEKKKESVAFEEVTTSKNASADVEVAREVIELLDDDEVSLDEEEDEVICVGTFNAKSKAVTVAAAAVAEPSRGRSRQRTATACPRKTTVTAAPERAPRKSKAVAVAEPAFKRPRKETTVPEPAVERPRTMTTTAAATAPVPERPSKKTVKAAPPTLPLKKNTVSMAAPELPLKKPATVTAGAELPRKKSTKAQAATPELSRKKKTATEAGPENLPKRTSMAATRRRKKTVSFGNVQVQEYRVILGDHPKCKGAYPISLDWAHTKPNEYDLDAREKAKKDKYKKAVAKAAKDERGGYGEKKKMMRQGKARRLSTTDRSRRIVKVSGISKKELRKLEGERLLQIHEAKHGRVLSRLAASANASKGKSLRGYNEV